MQTKLIIEQHFHGCFGIDFNKASVDDVLYLSKEILKYRIGGIFPTLVTDSVQNKKKATAIIKEASQKQTSDMAKILGIHLEGIFINPEKKGIHNPKHFLAPTIENYKLVEDDFIKIYSLKGRVSAATEKGEYSLRMRLYEIEEKLCSGNFVRISNSEIINLKKVKNFDLSFTGTILVRLSDGTTAYVSRRYVSKIKKILGF